jgi:hypothetical protein
MGNLPHGLLNILLSASLIVLILFTILGIREVRASEQLTGNTSFDIELTTKSSSRLNASVALALELFFLFELVGIFLPLYRSANLGPLFPKEQSHSWGWAFWQDFAKAPQMIGNQSAKSPELLFVFFALIALVAFASMMKLSAANTKLARVVQWASYGLIASVLWVYFLFNNLYSDAVALQPGNPSLSITSILGIGFYVVALSSLGIAVTASMVSISLRHPKIQ